MLIPYYSTRFFHKRKELITIIKLSEFSRSFAQFPPFTNYIKVNRFSDLFSFFRHFMIYQQNICSCFGIKISYVYLKKVWIMWITSCITRFHRLFGVFWCGKLFSVFFAFFESFPLLFKSLCTLPIVNLFLQTGTKKEGHSPTPLLFT